MKGAYGGTKMKPGVKEKLPIRTKDPKAGARPDAKEHDRAKSREVNKGARGGGDKEVSRKDGQGGFHNRAMEHKR